MRKHGSRAKRAPKAGLFYDFYDIFAFMIEKKG